jgi:uncharacterized protein YjdB
MKVTPNLSRLTVGQTAKLDTEVTVNGTATSDCDLIWQTSDSSVVSVSDGSVKAISSGTADITVTLTGADCKTFIEPVTITISLTVI